MMAGPVCGATSRLALLLVAAGVFATAAAASAHPTIAAPVLAWSDQPHLQPAGSGAAAASSYQVFSDLGAVLKQLLSASLHHSDGSDGVVLLALGSQLKTSDLHSRVLRAPLASLQALLTGAASSVSMPFVLHTVAPASEQQRRAVELASAAGATTTVVGCDGTQGGQQALVDALQGLGSGPAVVVLCTASTSGEAGTPEAVAAELQQVQDAHAAVAALGRRQTTVYAVTPDADALPLLQRRQLQGVAADVGACGQLCQTQVKWLEGLLAAFILVIAAISGMSCLYALDTPTRFQKPKEGGRAE